MKINLKHILPVFSFLLMLPLLVACGGSDDEPQVNPDPVVPPSVNPEVEGRTVLVYMAAAYGTGSDLSKFAEDDLAEMEEIVAKMDLSKNHLLIYCDDCKSNSATLRRLYNDNGKAAYETLRTYESNRNSTGLDETIEVFQDAFNAYPGSSYGLVYWSHGGGWMPQDASTRWIGYDKGREMNIDDFATALQSAPHLDFLLFDCCFMQCVEVAYELRDYADYFIGSPTEIPGPGGPYTEILPAFYSDNPGLEIPAAYYNSYERYYDTTMTGPQVIMGGDTYDADGNWRVGVSISSIKSSALASLAQATADALKTVEASLTLYQMRSGNFDYDYSNSYCLYDFQVLMETVLSESRLEEWKSYLDDALAFWKTTPLNYTGPNMRTFSMEKAKCGITHYIPKSTQSTATAAHRNTSWYKDAGILALGW